MEAEEEWYWRQRARWILVRDYRRENGGEGPEWLPGEVLHDDVLVHPAFALVLNTRSTPWWDVPVMVEKEGWGEWGHAAKEEVAWAWVVRVRHNFRTFGVREFEWKYPGWKRHHELPRLGQYLQVELVSEYFLWQEQCQWTEQWWWDILVLEWKERRQVLEMALEWEAARVLRRRYGVLPPRWPYRWREYLRAVRGGLQVAVSRWARRREEEFEGGELGVNAVDGARPCG